jgi:SAM-dependent methyltransferase
MKRMQLVELEDLPWFPAVLRDGGTAYLELAARVSGHGALLVPPLADAIRATGATRVIDLCSGGGGPARIVADALAERGLPVDVLLTDLYPNPRAFAHAAEGARGQIAGRSTPVDATDVPAELTGFRTIFNAFHHFPPARARAVLADAVAKRQPIGVFELVSREPAMLAGLLTAPVGVTLTVPFWRPFRWSWLLWTWLIPLMQPFVLWDGIVSWLRIYSVDELRALVADLDAPDWTWEIGQIKLGSAPLHATYLIGRPTGARPAPVEGAGPA